MFGFVGRLRYWLEKAALGELDPIGGPLHPPAVSPRDWSLPMIIPRADTPPVTDRPWLGLAALNHVSPRRIDIVGSIDIVTDPWPPKAAVAALPQPLTWEYPRRSGTCSTSSSGKPWTGSSSYRCCGRFVVRGAVHGERACAQPARDDVSSAGLSVSPRGRFGEPPFSCDANASMLSLGIRSVLFRAAIKVSRRGERTPKRRFGRPAREILGIRLRVTSSGGAR
jgi:hypothetical protein